MKNKIKKNLKRLGVVLGVGTIGVLGYKLHKANKKIEGMYDDLECLDNIIQESTGRFLHNVYDELKEVDADVRSVVDLAVWCTTSLDTVQKDEVLYQVDKAFNHRPSYWFEDEIPQTACNESAIIRNAVRKVIDKER